NQDPFHDLNDQQRITALTYLDIALKFSRQNIPLYGEVFETSMYPDGEPLHAELIKKGGPGQLNTYRVYPKPLTLIGGDKEQIPTLIQKGYIPLVGSFGPSSRGSNSSKEQTAKQLAALLAMKSVEMIFPATKGVDPKLILEARDRLSDHLPPFWAAMLKLSIELRARIKDCKSPEEVFREADFMVDTLVRPAAIDLKRKIELERKKWFYKILMPIQAGLRLLIGKPILTQQQLLTSALILGADVALASAENMKIIEALKNEAGLTFLLEAGDTLRK
ncbi:hypothetical protein, partial [Archangium sp.]|uniref:hypothetical protein n=1 Tax=Archangium sp. TaxID=1872627 RepID=UPI002EDAF918